VKTPGRDDSLRHRQFEIMPAAASAHLATQFAGRVVTGRDDLLLDVDHGAGRIARIKRALARFPIADNAHLFLAGRDAHLVSGIGRLQ
jgi:hypothetical protein